MNALQKSNTTEVEDAPLLKSKDSFSGFPEWLDSEVLPDKFNAKLSFVDSEFEACMPPCLSPLVDEYKLPQELLVQSGYNSSALCMTLPMAQMTEYFSASLGLPNLLGRDGSLLARQKRPATTATGLYESNHSTDPSEQSIVGGPVSFKSSSEFVHPRSAPASALLDKTQTLSGVPVASKLFVANQHLLISEAMRQLLTFLNSFFEQYRPAKIASAAPGLLASSVSALGDEVAPWDLIYPKGKDGLPALSQSGRYVVKLYWLGAYRAVTVDDHLPVDEIGRPLVLTSPNLGELWIPILCKAVLKIASLSYAESECVPNCILNNKSLELDTEFAVEEQSKYHFELGSFDVASALKGLHVEKLNLASTDIQPEMHLLWLDSQWEFIKNHAKRYNFLNSFTSFPPSGGISQQQQQQSHATTPQPAITSSKEAAPAAPTGKPGKAGSSATEKLKKEAASNSSAAAIAAASHTNSSAILSSNAALSGSTTVGNTVTAGNSAKTSFSQVCVFGETIGSSTGDIAPPFPTLVRIADWKEQKSSLGSSPKKFLKLRYSIYSSGMSRLRINIGDSDGAHGAAQPQMSASRRRPSLSLSSAGQISHAAQNAENNAAQQNLKKTPQPSTTSLGAPASSGLSSQTQIVAAVGGTEAGGGVFSSVPHPDSKDIIESWVSWEEFCRTFSCLKVYNEPQSWKLLAKWNSAFDSRSEYSEKPNVEAYSHIVYLKDASKSSTLHITVSTFGSVSSHTAYNVPAISRPASLSIQQYDWKDPNNGMLLSMSTNSTCSFSFPLPANTAAGYKLYLQAVNKAVVQLFASDDNIVVEDETRYLTDVVKIQVKEFEEALPVKVLSQTRNPQTEGSAASTAAAMQSSYILFKSEAFFKVNTVLRAAASVSDNLPYYVVVHLVPSPELDRNKDKATVPVAGQSTSPETKADASVQNQTLQPVSCLLSNSAAQSFVANPSLRYVVMVEAIPKPAEQSFGNPQNVEADTNIGRTAGMSHSDGSGPFSAQVAASTAQTAVTPAVSSQVTANAGGASSLSGSVSHNKLAANNKWRFRLFADPCLPAFVPEKSLETGLKPLTTEIEGSFAPTFRQRVMFRQVLKVKDVSATSVSVFLSINIPDMAVSLQLFDQGVEIARSKGRGGASFLAAVIKRNDDRDATSASVVTGTAAGAAAGSKDASAQSKSSKTVAKTAEKQANNSSAAAAAAAVTSRPIEATTPNYTALSHRYIIQAVITDPDLSKWMLNSKSFGSGVASVSNNENGGAESAGAASVNAPSNANKKGATMPRRQTVSNSGANAGNPKSGSLSGTGGSSDDILTNSLVSAGPLVFYSLKIISSSPAALSLARDTEKDDRMKQVKDGWEAKQPGRSAKARELRESFLKQFAAGQIKPPYMSGYPLATVVRQDQILPAAAGKAPPDGSDNSEKSQQVSPKTTKYLPWDIVKPTDLDKSTLELSSAVVQGFLEI